MIKDPISNEYVTVNSVSIFSERTGDIVTILDILSLSWGQRNYFLLSQVSDVKLLSRIWLFVTPMDCSLPGSSVHGIFQARILEWVAISFSFY